MSVLQTTYYGNDLLTWIYALVVAVAALMAFRIVRSLIARMVRRFAERTETVIDDVVVDMLGNTKFFLMLALAIYLGSLALSLPEKTAWIVSRIAVIALFVQAALWGNEALRVWFRLYRERRAAEDPSERTSLAVLQIMAQVGFWVLVGILALDNLGFDVSALVAGLGIGGIAVALAVQNILGDLFASLSIVLDKPFAIGDFLRVDDYMGTVDHIGLKTTRLRSITGEQLVFNNSDLLGSRIRNFGRMQERRGMFEIGVTYQTPPDKLEQIPGMIREAIESRDNTRFDRSHFKAFGDSALVLETVYYMTVPDYAAFMDTQEAVNLELYRRFEEEGIEFAYPTRTLYVSREAGPEGSTNRKADEE